jgi:hypothetical protein
MIEFFSHISFLDRAILEHSVHHIDRPQRNVFHFLRVLQKWRYCYRKLRIRIRSLLCG